MLFDLTYKLNTGERFVGIARKHWFLIIPKLLESLAIIALLIIFANKFIILQEKIAITFILIAAYLAYIAYIWILWRIDYFIITSERIIRIKQTGFYERTLNEISLSDIRDIALNEKGIAAAFLKFGSIKITSKNGGFFTMASVADPIKVYQGLVKLKEIKKT